MKLSILLPCLVLCIAFVPAVDSSGSSLETISYEYRYLSYEDFTSQYPSTQILFVDDTAGPGGDGSLDHPYQKISEGVDKASDGFLVYVFNGVYSENIEIGKSITLVGENPSDTILRNPDVKDWMIKITADNTKVMGFTIDGSKTNGIEGDITGMVLKSKNVISNIYVRNCLSGGIEMEGAGKNNNVVTQCSFENCHKYGVYIEGGQYNSITNNSFSTINSDLGGAIWIKATFYNFIMGNTFRDCSLAGIVVEAGAGGISMVGNTFRSCDPYGVWLSDAGWFNFVASNDFEDNAEQHAYFYNTYLTIWVGNYWGEPFKQSGEKYTIYGNITPLKLPWTQHDIRQADDRNNPPFI